MTKRTRKERKRKETKTEEKRECSRIQASQECASKAHISPHHHQTKGRCERSSRAPSLVSAARTHATKRKSLPVAANRDGGGVGLPGTGSPRKTFALDRWIQHEITAYQRCTSADGSRPRAAARLCASALMNPTVSCAQKP